MPGEPQDVRVNAVNSTTIHVAWKAPLEKDRNGIIMGYHIHVQETKEEVCVICEIDLRPVIQLCLLLKGTKFLERTDEI